MSFGRTEERPKTVVFARNEVKKGSFVGVFGGFACFGEDVEMKRREGGFQSRRGFL